MNVNDRFLDPNIPDELATSIRPKTLSDFIGHESLKQNLSVFISGAKTRNEAMDHVLLYGPPGLGKTTLAHIVANELGTNFRATSAPMLTKQGDLAAILTALEPMDVPGATGFDRAKRHPVHPGGRHRRGYAVHAAGLPACQACRTTA